MNKKTAAISPRSTIDSSLIDRQDEYHTILTKRLTDSSNNMNSLNSTEDFDETDTNESTHSLNDFVGGPRDVNYSFNLQSQQPDSIQDTDVKRSITQTPADSSCGFHNTFSVLENHLNKNKYFKLSQQQIEYLLLQNRDLAVQSDTYIDIPISNDQSLHRFNSSVDGTNNGPKNYIQIDEEPHSLFELEMKAIEELRSIWSIAGPHCHENEIDGSQSHCSSLLENLYQQDVISAKESNDYIYHVAKSRDGQLYIRVRRNLRVDKGKLIS